MSKATSTDNRRIDRQEILDRYPGRYEGSNQWLGTNGRHDDHDAMRRHFGIPSWDSDSFDYPLIPDLLDHEYDPDPPYSEGGTDLFIRGKPGSGKSSLLRYLAIRLLELNDEIILWRASPSRSEWLALAPWATVWLPEGVEVEVELASLDPTVESISLELSSLAPEVVRAVERYSDPRDLLDRVGRGQINIVYPDPTMSGCQAILEDISEKDYEIPEGRSSLFHPDDPSHHWFIALFAERVEHGPHFMTTLIMDEIGDLLPQNARKDSFGTYQKVQFFTDILVDARKKGLSIFSAGHSSKDLHAMVRRKIRWRCQMPNQANPIRATQTVGMESIPMNTDLASRLDLGSALFYSEQYFDIASYGHTPDPGDHKLQIKYND